MFSERTEEKKNYPSIDVTAWKTDESTSVFSSLHRRRRRLSRKSKRNPVILIERKDYIN